MKRLIIIILLILTSGEVYSQRIPFGFWNRGQRDTIMLDAPLLLYPANNETNISQSPRLDWDGVIYATHYVIQLASDTGFSSIAWETDTTSSRATVQLGLAYGSTWYWRVLAYNTLDTSDWSDRWAFTVTTGPALVPPELTAPYNDQTEMNQYVRLEWTDTVNVNTDNFLVQLSASTSFASVYWEKYTVSDTATIDSLLDYGSQWYWRVRAMNDFDTSDWSDTNTFKIYDPQLSTPVLAEPTDGAVEQIQSPVLVWYHVEDASFYRVELSQTGDFSSVFYYNNTFDTMKTVPLTLGEGTKWYWRVRAFNSDTSDWSSVSSFAVTNGTPTARAYYVDATSGKDEYSGRSTSDAWKTISRINTYTFLPGDSILLKGGEKFSGSMTISQSGSAISPIIIKSYGSGQAEINPSADLMGITVASAEYVTIRGIRVRGTYDPYSQISGGDVSSAGIDIVNSVNGKLNGIIIDSCYLSRHNGRGIAVSSYNADSAIKGGFNNLSITNCLIDSIGNSGILVTFFNSPLTTGQNLLNTNITISDNKIYRVTGWKYNSTYSGAGMLISDCDTALIDNCVVASCGGQRTLSTGGGSDGIEVVRTNKLIIQNTEVYGQTSPLYDGGGIHFDYSVSNSIIQFCYAHDNWGNGISLYGATNGGYTANTTGNTIRYNLVQYNGRGNLYCSDISIRGGNDTLFSSEVYNNTVYTKSYRSDTVTAGILTSGIVNGVNIRNNLIITGDTISRLLELGGTLISANIQGNNYWNTSGRFKLKDGSSTYYSYNYWQAANSRELISAVNVGRFRNPQVLRAGGQDTIGNTYNLDTMTAYKTYAASSVKEFGLNLDSLFGTDVGTYDFYGNTLRQNNRFDIGFYENPDTYIWQDTTKLFIGKSITPPTLDRQYLYDTLITTLQTDSIMRKAREFLFLATSDTNLALRSIKLDTLQPNTVGGMSFIADSGFRGNGSTSAIQMNLIPSSQGYGIYSQNNISSGIFINTDVNENKVDFSAFGGGYYIYLKTRNSGFSSFYMTNGTNSASSVSNSIGWWMLTRPNVDSVRLLLNGNYATGGSKLTTSTGIPTAKLSIGAFSPDNGVSYNSNSSKTYSIYWLGSNLTNYQNAKLYTTITWYLGRIAQLSGNVPLVAPIKDLTAIKLHSGSDAGYIIRQYNPPQYTFAGDSLRMYMMNLDSSKIRIAKSADGITWTQNGAVATSTTGNLFESVIRQNGSPTDWYGLTHYPITLGGKTQYFYKITNSTDNGVTFNESSDTLNDGSKWFGEDHSSFYMADSSKYYLLLRRESSSSTINRKLSLVKTTNFSTFSPRVLVAPADSTNFTRTSSKDFRKSFYFGSMFKTGTNEYWIYATVFKTDSAGLEYYQPIADTNATDNCTWGELLFSTDGDNWVRTNDSNAFIPLNNGYRQIYGLPTVVGDSLYIYTFESKARHPMFYQTDTDHFDIWRYVISLTNLRAYKP